MPDIRDIDVIAPHFKRRLSGVTSTVIQLIPRQIEAGVRIAVLGPGLPAHLPHLRYRQLFALLQPPASGRTRVWHARRNVEMLAGILLRDILRMPLKLLFTSAAQRHHTAFTRILIRRMDAVVATSARSGSFLEVPHRVIRHGIDTDLFQPAADGAQETAEPDLAGQLLVGCTGRIRHQKGTDLFVDAMIALLPDHPRWTAVIAGRVTSEHETFAAELRARIDQAGLAGRILFIGEVDDIKPWYQRFDLFVAPSRNEGFGLTPLEAMASGTPAVTSDAGAYAEMIIDGVTGAVVPAGDGAALTAAIKRYLDDPDLATAHGRDALAHIRQGFAIKNEVEGLRAVYDELGGKGR